MTSDDINRALLRSHNLRATPQRLALLKTLGKARQPLSIPELQNLSPSDAMDTATFYRSLETLAEAGIVQKINLQHAHTDYELVRSDAHHHHIVCRTCGKIADVTGCPDPVLEKKVLKESGFSMLDEHSIEFFGLCKACAKS